MIPAAENSRALVNWKPGEPVKYPFEWVSRGDKCYWLNFNIARDHYGWWPINETEAKWYVHFGWPLNDLTGEDNYGGRPMSLEWFD